MITLEDITQQEKDDIAILVAEELEELFNDFEGPKYKSMELTISDMNDDYELEESIVEIVERVCMDVLNISEEEAEYLLDDIYYFDKLGLDRIDIEGMMDRAIQNA